MSERRRGETSDKPQLALPNFANLSEYAPPDLLKFTGSVVSTLSEVNSSLISFAQASLQNHIAAADELRQVQNPKDLVDVQIRIARRAYDDYVEEATKISEIVQRLSTDALAALNPPRPL
jgi:phasin family protein